ncbi:MAG: Gfo/Idh/MocA family oxidoreductase [Bacteroidales bacterium]|jgi:hypothetical protein|nr:Gfo/Idh/MocA family oxidoreductase [Bacteroidales bacterium]
MSSIIPINHIKIAVFGVNTYGKNCIKHILGKANSELVGFYEPDEELAYSIMQLFDLKRYTDADELLEAADAVIISLPVEKRYETAALSLKKGKHILVESPVSFKISEIEHLISLANEAQVVHVTSIGGVLSLTESLAKGENELENEKNIFIECKRYIDDSKENIFEVLVEDLHLLLQITNSGIRKIFRNSVGHSISVYLEFENEMSAHYLISGNIDRNIEKIFLYTSSDKVITIKKDSKTIMVEKDIETLLSSISENQEHYPFFEKDFVSIFAANKIAGLQAGL